MPSCRDHASPAIAAAQFNWIQTKEGPVCTGCGINWPGHPLPEPVHQREGYGDLAKQPGWNQRVAAMVGELSELEEATN